MRNMSFALTTEQYLAGTKDVTRRLGWWFLKPDDQFRAVRKAMGLKKGEKVEPLGINRVISTRGERLADITPEDVIREGFPGMTPAEFVEMFCRHMRKANPDIIVNRIEYQKLKIEV